MPRNSKLSVKLLSNKWINQLLLQKPLPLRRWTPTLTPSSSAPSSKLNKLRATQTDQANSATIARREDTFKKIAISANAKDMHARTAMDVFMILNQMETRSTGTQVNLQVTLISPLFNLMIRIFSKEFYCDPK